MLDLFENTCDLKLVNMALLQAKFPRSLQFSLVESERKEQGLFVIFKDGLSIN